MTENTENNASKANKVAIIDDDKNTKLHYSAASGNEEDVLKDLQNQQKIDLENYLGWTPLMMACRNGHFEVVKLLLDRRADATRKNKFGISVLLVSIASGKLEIVHLILQHLLCGGVSRQSMQSIFSPISMAILFDQEEVLKYILEQSFNINATTPVTGITPLMFATAMENCKAFTLLLTKGADTTLRNYLGQTAQDIRTSRQKKVESANEHLQQRQQFVQQVPMIVVSPQPTFISVQPSPMMRKSSNVMTPNYFLPPNMTPITPVNFVSQMFFPPDFSPNQFVSPVPSMYPTHDYLNYRMPPNAFMSPMPQHMNFPSPCV